jgi:hypothetical protein
LRRGLILLVLIVAGLLYGGPASFARQEPTASTNKLGVHLLLDDGRGHWPMTLWADHMLWARRAVGPWGFAVQLVRSEDLDPARWQYFMDLCGALELTPVVRLATVFDRALGMWTAPVRDADGSYRTAAAQYAEFVAALRWPVDAHYVIVGNEPNHGNEWGGRPDPAGYARFLADVAAALRAADPQVKVLNAGLDHYAPHTGSLPFAPGGAYFMDAETFMDEMARAVPGVFGLIDIWASHPYPMGPFTEPPWAQTFGRDLINDARNLAQLTPPSGIFNRGVNGYEWELIKLESYGVRGLPVLITETGWRKAETTDPSASDNGRPLPDAATVADYLDLTLRGNRGRFPNYPETGWTPWLDDPRVMGAAFFALDGRPIEWGHTNWLMVDATGTVQGTYAMLDLLRSIAGE